MAKILITGGSGLVGKAISKLLLQNGHEPVWLSRESGTEDGVRKFRWNLRENYIDQAAFKGVEHVIHLAGAGVMDKRWTTKYRKEIIDSRSKSGALLYEHLKENRNIKSLTGASAIGYYGTGPKGPARAENDESGTDFLSSVCRLWEESYRACRDSGIRTTILRTGIVLSANGGALKELLPVFKLGIGSALGSGRQVMPWIHVDDLARLYLECVFNERMNGVYNAVGGNATNFEFSHSLAKQLDKTFFMPHVPAAALKFFLGERSSALLKGVAISNEKLKKEGFVFEYPALESALSNLLDQ